MADPAVSGRSVYRMFTSRNAANVIMSGDT